MAGVFRIHLVVRLTHEPNTHANSALFRRWLVKISTAKHIITKRLLVFDIHSYVCSRVDDIGGFELKLHFFFALRAVYGALIERAQRNMVQCFVQTAVYLLNTTL